MSRHFIPRADTPAMQWMRTFSAGIASDPAKYLITVEQSDELTDHVNAFAEAYARANDPATRTRAAVSGKDDARAVAERACRSIAAVVRANPKVTSPDKISLGLRIPAPRRPNTIARPRTRPTVVVAKIGAASHVLSAFDSGTDARNRKPQGVQQMQVYCVLGDQMINDVQQARLHTVATRLPVRVSHARKDDGKVATYFARWVSPRGEPGPWSLATAKRIAA